jgi:23S rRNA pseudouridine1911/1915/1917 synthase
VARLAPRAASTSYQKLREHGAWALVEVRAPKAARHQIRAHFAAIGHPLAGDRAYGGHRALGLERQFLHSARVAFRYSGRPEAIDASSPLPDDLAQALRQLAPG